MKARATLLLMTVAVSWACIFAQSTPANTKEQARISVPIFVSDTHGNPVTAIGDGAVSIEDESKRPRTVIAVTHDESPLRLGILVDKSNSQSRSGLFKAGVQGLNAFLKQVLRQDGDRVFIEPFDTIPDRPTPWMKTNELGNMRINLTPSGGSSLFDAIKFACRERFADNAPPARRVLVVLTDGEDNSSQLGLDDAIAAAQRAKAVIIAISTYEEQNVYQQRGGDSVLKRLAENTGGHAFLGLGTKETQKVFSQLTSQLDSMFQVDYVPVESARSGEVHQLHIAVKSGSGKKLVLWAPKRYYPAVK